MDSERERNFHSLLLLLMRVGSPKLRDFFIRKWDSAPGHRPWTDCPQDGADLTLLWKPTLLPYEKPKVLCGNTLEWDLSLFVKILSLNEPRRGMRRALDKLKALRNSLCHSHEPKLTNHDFHGMWNDACNALTLFGAKSKDFKSVKKDAEQPLKDIKPVVVKWMAHEFELLHNGQLQLLQGQTVILDKIRELKEMQHTTAGGTTEVEPKQPDTVANESMACEGKELLEYLKEYYQTGERAFLLPFSWMEGDQFHIENIYTKMKIVEMNTKHVTSLEELSLKAGSEPKNMRRILLEGEPGIGKSAICKKIAYEWSMNKLFSNFEVVLSLKCRDFHTTSDLWEAIEMQTFSDELKEKKTEIFKYIKNNPSKVLLVLDGYDEIPDNTTDSMKQSVERLICGKLLPRCSVIVTSRTGEGSSEIRNHFDRKLELKGFELEDSFTFIRRFFASSPEANLSSITFIENCEAAKDLVRNPLITAILCLQEENNEELNIRNLNQEILFSITKRYFVEKLGQQVNDDEITKLMQDDKFYEFSKVAFILTVELDRGNEADEDELRKIVHPTGSIAFIFAMLFVIESWIRKRFFRENLEDKVDFHKLMKEFLVYKKPNAIRTTPCYTFLHVPLKENLAANYVIESFRKGDVIKMMFILAFMAVLAFKDRVTFVRVVSLIRVAILILKWWDVVRDLVFFLFSLAVVALKT